MRWREVCALGGQLPEAEAGHSYGVAVLRVRGSFLARLADDGKSVVVKVGAGQRDEWCRRRPSVFMPATDDSSGSMITVLLATVDPIELWPVLVESWRRSAPPTLVAQRGQELPTPP